MKRDQRAAGLTDETCIEHQCVEQPDRSDGSPAFLKHPQEPLVDGYTWGQ